MCIRDRSWNNFDERILLVVLNGDFTVEWRYFNSVAMNSGSGWCDLKVDRLSIASAKAKLFRFDRASIFADSYKNLGCGVTGQPNAVSYTHLRAHETPEHLVCRLL